MFDLLCDLVGHQEQSLVEVDITRGDALAGVPEQARDGQLGEAEVPC
jgi:hypothetical protein